MVEGRPPQSGLVQRVSEQLADAVTRARLMRMARWLTDTDADAQDLLQQALARVCDPDGSPWDPSTSKTFFFHVGSVMNGLASNEWRSARVRREIIDTSVAHDKKTIDGAPLADEALDAHRSRAELVDDGERLLQRLGDRQERAIQVIRAAREGCETKEEMAVHLGCPVEEVVAACRVLKYHARAVLEERAANEAQRMGELRKIEPNRWTT